MSSIKAQLTGDNLRLAARMQKLGKLQVKGVMNAIAEGLRTSTVERFSSGTSPEGESWKPSMRTKEGKGRTLIETSALRNSIRAQTSETGFAVGTNDVKAATHQFGDSRTIRAKKSKYLVFPIGGQFRKVIQVNVNIPARPFLGISKDDEKEMQETLKEILEE